MDCKIAPWKMSTSNLRTLQQQLAKETDPEHRRRFEVVVLLEGKLLSWPKIYARTGVRRSTAYNYRRKFRKDGTQGLLQLKHPGRPSTIPQVVRDRFQYLCRHDPSSERTKVVYVIERECAVYRVLKASFSSRQLTRWYRILARENNVEDRFLVFRRMRPAFKHLRPSEKLCFGSWWPKTPRDFKRAVRIDALNYASDRNPRDRELLRRMISATHRIPLSKIAFGDEPNLSTADFAWGAIPEQLEPVDIFAPRPNTTGDPDRPISHWLENV